MFTKQMKATSLVALTLIVGLLVTGVVGLARGRSPRGKSSEEEGIMEDTYIELLAPKVGLEPAELDEEMEEAMEQAMVEEERPISENYLEILASELNTDVEQLKTTMTETKVEAASKLEEEGTISEELANTFKERASTFPFGYSNQGAEKGKSQRASQGKVQRNDGRYDGDSPRGRQVGDDEEDDQSRGKGRGRN